MNKACRDCGEVKPLDDFYRHPGMADGRLSSCKDCRKAYSRDWRKREERRAKDRERKSTPEYKEQAKVYQASVRGRYPTRDRNRLGRLRRLGLTPDLLVAMMASQGNACAICRTPLDPDIFSPDVQLRRHVDHDHSCCPPLNGCPNCIRGVLCHNCNRMLGMARDDPEVLRRAASYLVRPPPAKVLKKKR
jgi:hypothetical protein